MLAGDSNNVALALELALRDPARFEGLVLAAGIPWGFDTPAIRRFVAGMRSDFAPTVEFFSQLCLPEEDSEHLRRWLNDMITRTGPDAAAALVESYYEVDLRERLGDVKTKTLVIHGSLDATSAEGTEAARELAEAMPDARLEVIEGVGHVPMLSRPDTVAELIDEFMSELAVSNG